MPSKSTRAAEAQSASVIAQARALEPTIRKLLEDINAVLDSRPEPAPSHGGACQPSDRTGNRLRAYVASMRRLRDAGEYTDDIDDAQQRGRALIERLAVAAEDSGPPHLMLTAEQVADVLAFMQSQQPVKPETWWEEDRGDVPCHLVGFYLLLGALEDSLREPPEQAGSEAAGMPEALKDHLLEQQTRVGELLSLLEQLDEDADQMYTRIAVREAKEIEKALDQMTLHEVMGGESQA